METQTLRKKSGRLFYAFLLALIAAYAAHFLSFTVFEGFATFSNDAASYVIMARSWSPFFAPTYAEVFTTPFHAYPPAFPFLLSITGASESLWASHLLVSVCLLAAVFMMGIFLGKKLSRPSVFLLLIAFCFMPGVIINSLGILSENLYLLVSLAALTTYVSMTERERPSWIWYTGLLALLSIAILTRTAGISLLVAFMIAPALNRQLAANQRILIPLIAGASILTWQVWELVQAPSISLSYLAAPDFPWFADGDLSERVSRTWQSIYANLVELLYSWNNYLFLNNFSAWMFALAYALLIPCVVCLGLRAAHLRIDAFYVVCYVGVILFWPYPAEIDRFLHPIAWLILAQPFLYIAENRNAKHHRVAEKGFAVMLILLIGCTAFVHAQLIELRREANSKYPRIAHSLEYYDARFGDYSVALGHVYGFVSSFMTLASDRIPDDGIVASVKHENFALLADRAAVTLSALVSHHQQLCNFMVQEVDAVFLSQLTSPLNNEALDLLDAYQPFAREVLPMESEDGLHNAYLLLLDRDKVEQELEVAGFACNEFRYVSYPEQRMVSGNAGG